MNYISIVGLLVLLGGAWLISFHKSEIKIHGINSSFEKTIKDKDYVKLIITSRDVSKKSFKHYLLKEIYETKDIVESTLRRYITI